MVKINQKDGKGLKQGYWEEEIPFHPENTEAGIYIDNKKEGIWKVYFNGDLSSRRYKNVKYQNKVSNLPPNHRERLIGKGKYKSGEREGTWREWWLFPTKKAEGKYKEGEKHGEWRFYHNTISNTVSEIGTYIKGEMSGIWTRFHENGRLQSEGPYIEDKKEGIWKWYNTDGTLDSIVPFKSGLEEGISERYWRSGSLWQRGLYKSGNRVALWCVFFEGELKELNFYEVQYEPHNIINLFLAATKIPLSSFNIK
jgi:antitoxin component YwqK of YwqJK toxin-antitoxin module